MTVISGRSTKEGRKEGKLQVKKEKFKPINKRANYTEHESSIAVS